jgi:hypothetical protein
LGAYEFTYRNQSPGEIYNQVSYAANINVDSSNMGGYDISNIPSDDGIPSWHHSCSATELLSSFMPPTSFSPIKVLI